MFDAAKEILETDRVIRYRISRHGRVLSYLEVVDLWQTDPTFQDFFTSLLGDSSFQAFRWETPALNNGKANQPFEFVLVNTPGFVGRRTDPETYSGYFTDTDQDDGVVCFQNLHKDATLVVPSPRGENDVYGHLAAFVRGAPQSQVGSLWRVLGRTVSSQISDTPIWVSTAGGGVAWLHVRIDSRPKYYSYADYKTA